MSRNSSIGVSSTLVVADRMKTTPQDLPQTVRQRASELRKSTSRGPITNVHVNLSVPPEQLTPNAIQAIAACPAPGLFVPVLPGMQPGQQEEWRLSQQFEMPIVNDDARPAVGKFVAELPSGESIELAGITAGARDQQTAWTADGRPIAKVSRDWRYGLSLIHI